jgi:ABC-2 type transport system permease protein
VRLSQAWLVASHDLSLIRKRRSILYGLVAFALGISVGFPLLTHFILQQAGTGGVPTSLLKDLSGAFSFWYVIGAATLPVTIASYSLVGEKIEKSLEPLLATPTTDSEILLGKALAAFLPTILAIWGGASLFMVLMDRETRGTLGYNLYPNPEMAVILLALAPLTAMISIEVSILISARASDVRTAQQISGLLFFPFILIYVGSEAGFFPLDLVHLGLLGVVFAVLVLVLFVFSRAAFQREEILTRWR